MAEVTRSEGVVCISYNQDEVKNARETFLRSRIIDEAVPIELLKREHPADVVMDVDTSVNGPIEVKDMNEYPYNTCGQIMGQIGAATCMGSASEFKRPDIILTAAHCVYNSEQKAFLSKPTFYWKRKENTAYAIVPVTHIFIPEEYEKEQDPCYDYAVCVLDHLVGDTRNVLQYDVKCSKDKALMIGYPGGEPYGGKKMYYAEDSANVEQVEGKRYLHVKDGLAYGGASGGPWTVDNLVFGINSWIWAGRKEVFSPILDEKLDTLYEKAVKVAPLKSISQFKLENDWGWFVCEIHTQYEGKTYEDDDDILINGSGISSLAGHVTEYAVVNIKVYVAAGTDNYGSERFIFDPNVKVRACYKISGTTLNNDLSFEGYEEY
ncbi:MAG: trypsin-like serine peptidase [Lachnospiraceae bacterium]